MFRLGKRFAEMPAGRPSDYRPEFAEQGRKLAKLGAIDRELADFFGVAVSTIYLWKIEHEEFSEAIKLGKNDADARVEQSLFARANGYSHDAVKIFCHEGEVTEVSYTEHYPPDSTAMIFWLKNRRPDLWRDVQHREHSGNVSHLSPSELDELERQLAGKEAAAGGESGEVASSLPE